MKLKNNVTIDGNKQSWLIKATNYNERHLHHHHFGTIRTYQSRFTVCNLTPTTVCRYTVIVVTLIMHMFWRRDGIDWEGCHYLKSCVVFIAGIKLSEWCCGGDKMVKIPTMATRTPILEMAITKSQRKSFHVTECHHSLSSNKGNNN